MFKNKKQTHELHGTTIVAVRKNKKVCIAADGQVSLGQTIIKGSAKKSDVYHQEEKKLL